MTTTLDALIMQYVDDKKSLEDYKKIVDVNNTEIKNIMAGMNIDKYQINGYTAKITVQNRETLNVDKLLTILESHKDEIPNDIVKMRPYVDMEALESAIYNEKIDNQILIEMDKCRETKEVTTLRVSKSKSVED